MESLKRPAVLLPILSILLVLGLAFFAGRRRYVRNEPSESFGPPAAERPSALSTGAPARSPDPAQRRDAAGSPERNNLSLFLEARHSVADRFRSVLREGGVQGAYLFITGLLRSVPQSLPERVQRSYAIRFLPYLAASDPSLRPGIESLLITLTRDPDLYARQLSLATLLDRKVLFYSQVGSGGFWLLGPQEEVAGAAHDDVPLKLSWSGKDPLRNSVRGLYDVEGEWQQRQFIVRVLMNRPEASDAALFGRAATADPDESVRYWAIEALCKLPLTEETKQSLLHAMSGDPGENNRRTAAFNLIDLGFINPVMVSQLAQSADQDKATYRAIARGYSLSRSPQLASRLRDGLVSDELEVRFHSIDAIARHGDSSLLPILAERLEQEKDPTALAQLKDALQVLARPEESRR